MAEESDEVKCDGGNKELLEGDSHGEMAGIEMGSSDNGKWSSLYTFLHWSNASKQQPPFRFLVHH